MTKTVTLGEVVTISPESFSPNGESRFYVGLEHIEKDTGCISPMAKVVPITAAKSRFHTGEILYGKLRPYLNKVAIAVQDGVCSTDILLLRSKPGVDTKYLYRFMLSKPFVDDMSANVAGANLPRVPTNYLLNYKIPLPPLPRQRQIAALLDRADALRQKDRQRLTHYDQLAQSLFMALFGDPVQNEKGWEVKTIGEVSKIEDGDRGVNYPNQSAIVESGVLFLSTDNIKGNKLIYDNVRFITENTFRKLSKGKLIPGDIILTLRGSVGNVAIFGGNPYTTGFINAQMAIIRFDRMSNVFFHSMYSTSSYQNLLSVYTTGSAQQQLPLGILKQLNVIVPPLALQQQFAAIIERIEGQKAVVRQQMAQSEALFQRLLQDCFGV